MIKYYAAAAGLKFFSINASTKKLYRAIGNIYGSKKREKAGLPDVYVERVKWPINMFDKYGIPKSGGRFIELGTGWIHWESTVLRLIYEGRYTLYDVWDNRQFSAFQSYIRGLDAVLEARLGMVPGIDVAKAKKHLSAMREANSYEEFYKLSGFEYVVEPTGMLNRFEPDSFDACFSCDVFEHIYKESLPQYLRELYTILKPGAYSVITIDLRDHLNIYDRSVHSKNYLKYSDKLWKLMFENEVQYFNRVQRKEWLDLFAQAGFELVEENVIAEPVPFKVDSLYAQTDRRDLECTILQIVHRKPA